MKKNNNIYLCRPKTHLTIKIFLPITLVLVIWSFYFPKSLELVQTILLLALLCGSIFCSLWIRPFNLQFYLSLKELINVLFYQFGIITSLLITTFSFMSFLKPIFIQPYTLAFIILGLWTFILLSLTSIYNNIMKEKKLIPTAEHLFYQLIPPKKLLDYGTSINYFIRQGTIIFISSLSASIIWNVVSSVETILPIPSLKYKFIHKFIFVLFLMLIPLSRYWKNVIRWMVHQKQPLFTQHLTLFFCIICFYLISKFIIDHWLIEFPIVQLPNLPSTPHLELFPLQLPLISCWLLALVIPLSIIIAKRDAQSTETPKTKKTYGIKLLLLIGIIYFLMLFGLTTYFIPFNYAIFYMGSMALLFFLTSMPEFNRFLFSNSYIYGNHDKYRPPFTASSGLLVATLYQFILAWLFGIHIFSFIFSVLLTPLLLLMCCMVYLYLYKKIAFRIYLYQ